MKKSENFDFFIDKNRLQRYNNFYSFFLNKFSKFAARKTPRIFIQKKINKHIIINIIITNLAWKKLNL